MEFFKTLVRHYHFTFGDTPNPSSFMSSSHERLLLWLKAIVPEFNASDLSPQNWQDGRFLALLLNYCCSSGTPHSISSGELSDIIHEAQETLGIPCLLEPSDLKSSDGDFILMMYLYFFVKPGHDKLLQWVNHLPAWKDSPTYNFQQDWSDGQWIYKAVHSIIPTSLPSLGNLSGRDALNITKSAMVAAERNLSIFSQFQASDVGSPTADPLPLILFLSKLQSVKSVPHHALPSSSVFIQKDLKTLQRVGSRVSIEVNSLDSAESTLQAIARGQDHEAIITLDSMKSLEKGTTTFSFAPQHVGHYSLAITCNGTEIPESPVDFDVYDPEKCQLKSPPQDVYFLGQPVTLDFSTRAAGKGVLGAVLTEPGGLSIPSSTLSSGGVSPTLTPQSISSATDTRTSQTALTIVEQDPQLYRISFIPCMTGIYQLSLIFNEKRLTTPWEFDCRQVYVDSLKTTPIKAHSTVKLSASSSCHKNVVVLVTDPHGKEVKVQQVSDDSYSYLPLEAGEYTASISLSGQPIPGSPFTTLHTDPTLAKYCSLTDLDSVLTKAKSVLINDPFTLSVNCHGAGMGTLITSIRSPDGKEKIIPTQDKDGCYDITFTPQQVGNHKMSLYWNDVIIPKFPLNIVVYDISHFHAQDGVRSAEENIENHFNIVTYDTDCGDLKASNFPITVDIRDGRKGKSITSEVTLLTSDHASTTYRLAISS